jgi:hypothetical protein
VIVVLCEGWPKSQELKGLLKLVLEQNASLQYAPHFYLRGADGEAEVLLEDLLDVLAVYSPPQGWLSRYITRPIVHRASSDDEFAVLLMEVLANEPSSTEKASIPRLLRAARGMTPDLRDWCIKELERQQGGAAPTEAGIDLVADRVRPVAHSLLDSLS